MALQFVTKFDKASHSEDVIDQDTVGPPLNLNILLAAFFVCFT